MGPDQVSTPTSGFLHHGSVPDPIFADHRLAALYDVVDDDRRDLDVHVTMVDELGASSVLDVGCGNGTFACRLALRWIGVVGLDPAAAALDVARGKTGAEKVRWIHGDACDFPAPGHHVSPRSHHPTGRTSLSRRRLPLWRGGADPPHGGCRPEGLPWPTTVMRYCSFLASAP